MRESWLGAVSLCGNIRSKLKERGDSLDAFGSRLLLDAENLHAFLHALLETTDTLDGEDLKTAIDRALDLRKDFETYLAGGNDPKTFGAHGQLTPATIARMREAQDGPPRADGETEVPCPACSTCPCCGAGGIPRMVTQARARVWMKRAPKEHP